MPKAAESFLFDFFTKAANEFYPNSSKGFVCPLCLQIFDSLAGLNRAHLWPESLGGRIFTLACCKCNSKIGSRIEKHEKARIDYVNSDKLPFTEKTEGVKGHIGGFYFVREIDGQPTLIMEISKDHSNPLTLAENRRLFDTGEISQKKVTLSYRGKFNKRTATLTYLHFAYMSLFHLTGYQWVETVQAAKIRDQLSKPKDVIFPVLFTELKRGPTSKLAEPSQPILFEVQGKTALQGYYIATPELPHHNGGRLGVWIPKLADTADTVLHMDSPPNDHFSLKYLGTVCRKPGQHATC